MKKNNKKGFTLAELLIVVAIVAVLTAIAIPVFSAQLEKSREATDAANVRSAYAEVVTSYLDSGDKSVTINVKANQKQSGWQTSPKPVLTYQGAGSQATYPYSAKTTGSYTVGITIASDGTATPSVT